MRWGNFRGSTQSLGTLPWLSLLRWPVPFSRSFRLLLSPGHGSFPPCKVVPFSASRLKRQSLGGPFRSWFPDSPSYIMPSRASAAAGHMQQNATTRPCWRRAPHPSHTWAHALLGQPNAVTTGANLGRAAAGWWVGSRALWPPLRLPGLLLMLCLLRGSSAALAGRILLQPVDMQLGIGQPAAALGGASVRLRLGCRWSPDSTGPSSLGPRAVLSGLFGVLAATLVGFSLVLIVFSWSVSVFGASSSISLAGRLKAIPVRRSQTLSAFHDQLPLDGLPSHAEYVPGEHCSPSRPRDLASIFPRLRHAGPSPRTEPPNTTL